MSDFTITWKYAHPTVEFTGEASPEMVAEIIETVLEDFHYKDDTDQCEEALRWTGWHDEGDCEHSDSDCPYVGRNAPHLDDLIRLVIRAHDTEGHDGPLRYCGNESCRVAWELGGSIMGAVA
jgi:hypothetical protein